MNAKDVVKARMVKHVSDLFGRQFTMRKGFTPDQAKQYMKEKGVVEFFDENIVKYFFDKSILTTDMVSCLTKQAESGRLENTQEGILKVCIFETRRRAHAFVGTANGAGYAGDHFRRVPENWDDPLALNNRKLGYFMLKDAWIEKVKKHFGTSDFYDKWLVESQKVFKKDKVIVGLENYELWLKQYKGKNVASSCIAPAAVVKKTLSATIAVHRIALDLKSVLSQFAEHGRILDLGKLEVAGSAGQVELSYNI